MVNSGKYIPEFFCALRKERENNMTDVEKLSDKKIKCEINTCILTRMNKYRICYDHKAICQRQVHLLWIDEDTYIKNNNRDSTNTETIAERMYDKSLQYKAKSEERTQIANEKTYALIIRQIGLDADVGSTQLSLISVKTINGNGLWDSEYIFKRLKEDGFYIIESLIYWDERNEREAT